VKVRIRRTPREPEVDGVQLSGFRPGTVRDVSPLLGAWLIAERYAEPEMRRTTADSMEDFTDLRERTTPQSKREPRRRFTDC
jgi:hypothetical protein